MCKGRKEEKKGRGEREKGERKAQTGRLMNGCVDGEGKKEESEKEVGEKKKRAWYLGALSGKLLLELGDLTFFGPHRQFDRFVIHYTTLISPRPEHSPRGGTRRYWSCCCGISPWSRADVALSP